MYDNLFKQKEEPPREAVDEGPFVVDAATIIRGDVHQHYRVAVAA